MIAVLTGDIINSQKGATKDWLKLLKNTLNIYGETPKDWEIFRGDSFQLRLPVNKAIIAAIHLKSSIKQNSLYDIRMAIGIGEETYNSDRVSEANGKAYVFSGECFESLKKHTLALKSTKSQFDLTINIMLQLILKTADKWTSTQAQVVKYAIENQNKTQKQLAELLQKSQSTTSEALNRAGFEEILMVNEYYKNNIYQL